MPSASQRRFICSGVRCIMGLSIGFIVISGSLANPTPILADVNVNCREEKPEFQAGSNFNQQRLDLRTPDWAGHGDQHVARLEQKILIRIELPAAITLAHGKKDIVG